MTHYQQLLTEARRLFPHSTNLEIIVELPTKDIEAFEKECMDECEKSGMTVMGIPMLNEAPGPHHYNTYRYANYGTIRLSSNGE